jgi:hypothetical protein
MSCLVAGVFKNVDTTLTDRVMFTLYILIFYIIIRYQDALLLKNFLLALVNNFSSLFYIGIVKSILSTAPNQKFILGKYFFLLRCLIMLLAPMLAGM